MKYKILVDSREKLPLFTKGCEVCKLDAGDYTIKGFENLLAIERKASVAEIAANLTEKRFHDWVGRLSQYKFSFLICEFTLADIGRYPRGSGIPKWRWKYLRIKSPYIYKMMDIIEKEYGIEVIYAGSRAAAKTKVRSIFEEVINSGLAN